MSDVHEETSHAGADARVAGAGARSRAPVRRDEHGIAPWKTEIRARASELHHEIELLQLESGGPAHAGRAAHRAKDLAFASKSVHRALEAANASGAHPVRWVAGTNQETAWLALHAAETALTPHRAAQDLSVEVPELLGKIDTYFALNAEPGRGWAGALAHSPVDPLVLQRIKRSLFEASDRSYQQMRGFRNILLAVSVVLVAVLIPLAVVSGAVDRTWLPLCPQASTTAGGQQTAAGGREAPDCSVDEAWKVELLGALGGLLTALVAIEKLRGYRYPYNLPLVQAVLKIPAGAFTALVGVIVVQSGSFGIDPVSGPEMAAYVILLGAAQELITRLLDQKARSIIEAAAPKGAA